MSSELYYSTPWHPNEFYKVAKLNTDISEITFSIPDLTNEQIRKVFGMDINKNTKETKKMEAKKCDRCGKLYETESADDMISVLFKQEKISDSDKERYSEFHNNERRTHDIRIRRCSEYNDKVDFCPDCRESFKKWFENADKEKK